jgi:hypothetical protein
MSEAPLPWAPRAQGGNATAGRITLYSVPARHVQRIGPRPRLTIMLARSNQDAAKRGPLGLADTIAMQSVIFCLVALLLAACVQEPPQPPAPGLSVEQRVQNLERRLDALERFVTNTPAPPLRSRAEIEANIHTLEHQRLQLLDRYQPAHPDIREIDLRLKLLRLQLQMLDEAPTQAK